MSVSRAAYASNIGINKHMINFRANDSISKHVSVFAHPGSGESSGKTACGASLASHNGPRAPTEDQLVGLAKALTSTRSRRKDFLTADLFGEPGWDMLLALYHAEAKGTRLTVTSLCAASQCPDTTALRWIEKLKQLGLVRRTKDRLDGRVFFIDLLPHARRTVSDYLREIWSDLFAG